MEYFSIEVCLFHRLNVNFAANSFIPTNSVRMLYYLVCISYNGNKQKYNSKSKINNAKQIHVEITQQCRSTTIRKATTQKYKNAEIHKHITK